MTNNNDGSPSSGNPIGVQKANPDDQFAKYLISYVASIFVFLHLFVPGFRLDEIGLILVMIGLSPWAIPFLRQHVKSAELPGIAKIEFLENEVKQQKKELETMKLFTSLTLPQWELKVFYKIYGNEPYMHDTSSPNQSEFRRDLGDLWGRGLIRQKRNEYLPWGQGQKNVKDWYEVSDLGHKLIEIRKEFSLDQS